MSINGRIKILIDLLANGRQNIFAEATNLKTTTINGIVGPRQSEPSFSTLKAIVDAYPMINLYWLIKGEGESLLSENQNQRNREKLKSIGADIIEKLDQENFLSSNLKLIREHLGKSQSSFAKMLGVSRDNIASYERGSKPKLSFLFDIVNSVHISMEELISCDINDHKELLEKIPTKNESDE